MIIITTETQNSEAFKVSFGSLLLIFDLCFVLHCCCVSNIFDQIHQKTISSVIRCEKRNCDWFRMGKCHFQFTVLTLSFCLLRCGRMFCSVRAKSHQKAFPLFCNEWMEETVAHTIVQWNFPKEKRWKDHVR